MKEIPTTDRRRNIEDAFDPRQARESARRSGYKVLLSCVGMLFCLTFAGTVPGADEAGLEYKVKAGFLFNFAKFVEWPAKTLPTAGSAIVLGVLADDPAAPVLRQALQNKVANGRPLTVKLLPDPTGLSACHIFFLSRGQKARTEEILSLSGGVPVLTVSETDEFARRGGMISFIRKDESFRFEVNLEAAERAGIKVSAKLASMATIVKNGK